MNEGINEWMKKQLNEKNKKMDKRINKSSED